MITLALATLKAQREARVSGEDVYVIEIHKDPEEIPEPLPPPTLADLAVIEEMRREDQELRRLWETDPEGCKAAGLLPPWEDEEDDELSDPHDPVYYSTQVAHCSAILVRDMGHGDFLIRVAHPDGTAEAISDPDAEAERLTSHYPTYLATVPEDVPASLKGA